MERITSRQNPLVKRFRELARPGRGRDHVLLAGVHLVNEALGSGVELEVVVSAEQSGGEASAVADRAAKAGARVVVVPEVVLAAVSPVKQPSDLVAIARLPATTTTTVLDGADLVLLVHAVQDPGNLGAIIRAAEASGASGLIADTGSADPRGWKVLRGSMGSALRLPVAVEDTGSAVRAARAAGLRVLATVPRGGTPLSACDLRHPCAILLGGEGPGLAAELIGASDARLTIPMRAPVESLNVAVAAGVILYEAGRQRAGVIR